MWASDLANFWNDLAVRPVFLPFMHQLLRYLADYIEPRAAYRVGQVLDLEQTSPPLALRAQDSGSELVVVSPDGDRELLQPGEARYLALDQAGVYRIRGLEGSDVDTLMAAANVDPRESDLTTLDPQELIGVVAASSPDDLNTIAAAMLSAEERERRQGLWWYLLAAAGVILAVETMLSTRAGERNATVRKR